MLVWLQDRRARANLWFTVMTMAVAAITLFGLLMIYSATAPRLEAAGSDPMHFVNRQMLSLGIGLVLMAIVVLFDYRQFRAWAPLLYGISIVLLVLTAATGETVKASRSWIVFGGFQFQPAELAKPALIVMLVGATFCRYGPLLSLLLPLRGGGSFSRTERKSIS